MFECFSVIHVTFSLVHGLPSSLSDALLEVEATGDQMKHIVTSRVQLSSLKVHTDLYVDLQTLWASSCFHGAAYRGIIVT